MKCVAHHEADAVGYCRQCGKALCADCQRDVRGVTYCEDCLAGTLLPGGQAAVPGAPNPGLALALGFIPGLGAVYNGEYAKALIHVVIFGGLISLFDTSAARGFEPLLGLLLAVFWFYMPIEAHRTAKRRAAGLTQESSGWDSLGFEGSGKATPLGPLILIVLGVLFLVNTLDIFHFHWFRFMWRFWPMILIGLGAWLLWRRTSSAPR